MASVYTWRVAFRRSLRAFLLAEGTPAVRGTVMVMVMVTLTVTTVTVVIVTVIMTIKVTVRVLMVTVRVMMLVVVVMMVVVVVMMKVVVAVVVVVVVALTIAPLCAGILAEVLVGKRRGRENKGKSDVIDMGVVVPCVNECGVRSVVLTRLNVWFNSLSTVSRGERRGCEVRDDRGCNGLSVS